MKEESRQAITRFYRSAEKEFCDFAASQSPDDYEAAVSLIMEMRHAGGRLHITGIGKPGHVAEYGASLLSSTGTPCYFLHGTEAVHGSCGQLVSGDVVIAISNSGETMELKATIKAIRNNGCRLIAVTADAESWLAKHCDVVLLAAVREEGGPLNRAPRNSVLAESAVLMALSAALQTECAQTPAEYVRCHPGGKLGELREGEK